LSVIKRKIVCLRKLLFSFSIVVASGASLCGNVLLQCTCSVYGFVALLIFFWFDVWLCAAAPTKTKTKTFKMTKHLMKEKSRNQQNHKPNTCTETTRYQDKKEPEKITTETQNSSFLKHTTCTLDDSE
jgi:hypothetical protein